MTVTPWPFFLVSLVYLLLVFCLSSPANSLLFTMAQLERKLPFGKIEPNSPKYFYSCMFGGIVGKLAPLNDQIVQRLIPLFSARSLW